jgi:hypothetical protein
MRELQDKKREIRLKFEQREQNNYQMLDYNNSSKRKEGLRSKQGLKKHNLRKQSKSRKRLEKLRKS